MEEKGQEAIFELFCSLVQDAEELLDLPGGSLHGDAIRVVRSARSRGLQVILVDLPNLCSSLERALDKGLYEPDFGAPFTKKGYPNIFAPIYALIFTDWVVNPSVKPESVRVLRQILKGLKKYRVDCPDERIKESIHDFCSIEAELPVPHLSWGDCHLRARGRWPCLVDLGMALPSPSSGWTGTHRGNVGCGETESLLSDLSAIQYAADRLVRSFEFRGSWFKPKHGPGAVSEPFGESKYDFPSWPERLEYKFPFDLFGLVNHQIWEGVQPSRASSPAKLIHVPKDFKSPRLIASEPVSSQFIQQGIMNVLRENVARSYLRHCIDFRSQEPSREMVLTASQNGDLSTIDLSSASDTLSCAVVECFFRRNYSLLEILNAARTPDLSIGSEVLRIKKFAAQGAAFTFPVQTIIYALICVGVVSNVRGVSHARAAREVRVYGDDMIVPRDVFPRVCRVLERLYLRVNHKKSFNNGFFLESCGMDAYLGTDVTPANILTIFTRDPNSLVSVVECSNNLYLKGFMNTARLLLETIPRKIRKDIPVVRTDSTILGIIGPSPSRHRTRYNASLQRDEVLVLVVENRVKKTSIDGHARLFQWFIENPSPSVRWKAGEVKRIKACYRLKWVPRHLVR